MPAPDPFARFCVRSTTQACARNIVETGKIDDARRRQGVQEVKRRLALRGVEPPGHHDFACRIELDLEHVLFLCCRTARVSAIVPRRGLLKRPLMARYANSPAVAPVKGAGQRQVRRTLRCDLLGHPQLVARRDTLITDGIHHLPHEEHARARRPGAQRRPPSRPAPAARADRTPDRHPRSIMVTVPPVEAQGHLDLRHGCPVAEPCMTTFMKTSSSESSKACACAGGRSAADQNSCRNRVRLGRCAASRARPRALWRCLSSPSARVEGRRPVRHAPHQAVEAAQLEHLTHRGLKCAERERDAGALRGRAPPAGRHAGRRWRRSRARCSR